MEDKNSASQPYKKLAWQDKRTLFKAYNTVVSPRSKIWLGVVIFFLYHSRYRSCFARHLLIF